ncbi:Uncharacterised protein [Campylobacter hyointestinalis subsp. hyointestinalis]|uniref:Uncharacterized protein n=1 Tax=Campylobacter hyointestinalis subsp. hyointestinalis TaxID=91352 RepID=A0A0S4RUT5_CAMHY|nr:hypothetical protein [Campylobacter hyointestinalis]CUU74492.1 Uncharacterised protein [Campylobacter hyointestinalis subsp. hyointestinalis]CUU75079.1 Uncharacterised protein [Campylobacter hyointestinalis subsp. hyointestinalis]CUU77790.1 Uncharacterised protein [Campylobacter hyointestinalis subsp. hyointestinalis]
MSKTDKNQEVDFNDDKTTDDEKPLFIIKDYDEKLFGVAIGVVIIMFIVYVLTTTTAYERSIEVCSFRHNNLLAISYGLLTYIILHLLFFKSAVISFYKNKITRTKGKKYNEIILNNTVNCYMGHLYFFSIFDESNNLNEIKYKPNKLKFIIRIPLSTIIPYFPIRYILSFFTYKEVSLNLKVLIVIDKNLNIISIPYYNNDKERIGTYFRDSLNINIEKLEARYSFDNFIKHLKGKI